MMVGLDALQGPVSADFPKDQGRLCGGGDPALRNALDLQRKDKRKMV